ncbi:MAG: SUMF1/EgtB/PvdO family nonheme iron enzyme [Bacteroidota bacterium]
MMMLPTWQSYGPGLRALGLAMLLLLAGGCSASGVTEEGAPGDDVLAQGTLCHETAAGTYVLLDPAPAERLAYLLSGDGVPGGPVPGRPGRLFTSTCDVVTDTWDGACPLGMAHIEGFCIDRWEAHLADQSPYGVPGPGRAETRVGVVPQGYISADMAARACQTAGKRLCTSPEWLRACQGSVPTAYPYGEAYAEAACNEGRAQHPVIELFGDAADWSRRQMNDPRLNQLPGSLAPTGSFPACVSGEGLYDLHGNLHEWVADAEGTFRGGFYVDATINGPGCSYRTTAHGRGYHDYSTGFRCCTDAR